MSIIWTYWWLSYWVYLKSVTRACNDIKFLLENYIFTNLVSQEVILVVKRVKNTYVADLDSIPKNYLTSLNAQSDKAKLWYKRIGRVSSSFLNKLASRDLVHGIPKLKVEADKVCEACIKRKHTRSCFRHEMWVSNTIPLTLIHIALCRLVKDQSRGGKKYIFIVMDDYSKFTWTIFLMSKDKSMLYLWSFLIWYKLNWTIWQQGSGRAM